ncbi:MAG: hypothetical protein FJ267_15115, partial [Planctomycetes bacterium]|nr:hypothetical protein [Planctomycetota bacterium]
MIRTRLTSQQAANVIIATVLLCGIPSYAQVESQKSAAQVEPATDTPNADSKKDGDLTPEAPVDATRISNASQVPDVCGIWKLIDPSGIALFKEIHIPKVLLMDESFEVNMYDSGSSFGSNKTISDFRWDAEQSQFVEVFTGKQRNANFKMAFRPVDEVSLEWTYFEDEETRIERQPLSPYPWSQYRDRDTLEQLKQSHNIFKRTGPLPTVFIEERDGLVVVTDDQGIAFFSRALGTWTRIAMGSQAIQR